MYRLIVSTLLVFAVASALGVSTDVMAAPSSEKGPRCIDGIDNDGDGLVDNADPDCGGDGSGGEDPPNPGPASCPGDFPALAYEVETRNKRGHTVRVDLYVSNADGTCSQIVHSVDSADLYQDLRLNFDSSSNLYRIVYKYESDEADTKSTGNRPNIRVIEFSVTNNDGVTTIDQTLPLVEKKIWRYSGDSTAGRGIGGISTIGNSLAFGLEFGIQVGTKGNPQVEWHDSIHVIDDISACVATLGVEPDESCASIAYVNEPNLTAGTPVFGLDSNRIYFEYDPVAPRDSEPSIGVMDRPDSNSAWSEPGILRTKSDDGADFLLHESSILWDYGLGPREVLQNYVDIAATQMVDVSSACTPAISSVDSCLAQGLAHVALTIPQWGKWTTHSAVDPGPNVIFRTGAAISEYDPDSGTVTEIIGGLPGHGGAFDPID